MADERRKETFGELGNIAKAEEMGLVQWRIPVAVIFLVGAGLRFDAHLPWSVCMAVMVALGFIISIYFSVNSCYTRLRALETWCREIADRSTR